MGEMVRRYNILDIVGRRTSEGGMIVEQSPSRATVRLFIGIYMFSIFSPSTGCSWGSRSTCSPSPATLRLFTGIYMFSIFVLNCLAVTCTKLCTGVVRALVQNGLRTAVVWMAGLWMHYSIDFSYGEAWIGLWSWVQLGGFLVYGVGMLLYMEIVSC